MDADLSGATIQRLPTEAPGERTRPFFSVPLIRASLDSLQRITVCTRPFRAAGPRLEAERLGDKLVIHNYGHGGSGWSLSWGSAALVVPLALAGGAQSIAVVGCGALGLTAALSLQRAGAKVAVYARELPPDTRSSRATGTWTPDSRIALAGAVDEAFAARWETMARRSYAEYQRSFRQPGTQLGTQSGGAIEQHDRYLLSDLPPDAALAARHRADPIGFAHLEHRLHDLFPKPTDFGPGEHPFPAAYCRHLSTLRFNITDYSHQLLHEFRSNGGTLTFAEFHTPQDLAALPETVIVNATGYGARALFNDHSVIPVRGQIGWLPAQPEANYSVIQGRMNMVSRRDGLVVQMGASSDETGWNDAGEVPDLQESTEAVRWLVDVQARRRAVVSAQR